MHEALQFPLDEGAVIDQVAAEQGASGLLVERDGAGRVTRNMQDLEGTVAGVDNVALVERAGERCRRQPVAGECA